MSTIRNNRPPSSEAVELLETNSKTAINNNMAVVSGGSLSDSTFTDSFTALGLCEQGLKFTVKVLLF